MKSKAIVIFLSLFLMAGCSNSSGESYATIVMINGADYYAQDEVSDNEFTVKEKIGEVTSRLDKEQFPKEDWSSNGFEEGSEIFSVNEKDNIFLIKTGEEEYTILAHEAKESE